MSSRAFRWVSSTRGDPAQLAALQEEMDRFYLARETRDGYQKYQDKRAEHPLDRPAAEYIAGLRPSSVLEVGCGDGRGYRALRRAGYEGRYLGLEIADYVVEECSKRHPDAEWRTAGAYAVPAAGGEFDVCLAFAVIESLVYPEKGISEMLRTLRAGGRLVLLFRDFIESGHFGSQLTGLSPGRASAKLKAGRWRDALLTWYDRKIRLPRALRRAPGEVGPFPVNVAPLALSWPQTAVPDYDVVYLSSKAEIESWAAGRGLTVEYPYGRRLPARSWAMLVIKKT
jgi:SAM-dependent methyltransferase